MLFELALAASVGVAIAAILSWLKSYSFRKTINLIPGPPTIPLFGNVLSFEKDSAEFYRQLKGFSKTYEDSGMFRLWAATEPVVMIYKAEFIEELLNSTKHLSKNFLYRFLFPWLGDGLLLSSGEKWHSRRRLITPTFHFKILEEFLKVFNEQAAILVGHLESKANTCEVFDIQPCLTHCLLDIICDSAMGQHVNAQGDTDSEYVKAVNCMSDLLIERTNRPWLWSDWLYSFTSRGQQHAKCLTILHGLTKKVIKQRSQEMKRASSATVDSQSSTRPVNDDDSMFTSLRRKRLAFLDMLLTAAKSDPSITDTDIQAEVDTFMFEGHDTTAAGAAWAMYMLGTHRDIQKKIQEEIDRVIPDDRPVTMEDISELKYTDCFLKEVLRFYPPVPAFGRVISEDCHIGGYKFPKGTSVQTLIEPMHRNPQHFLNPDTFDPDRWLTDKGSGRHPFSYLPFSAGLRNCIGQKFAMLEEKVIVCHVIKHFNITCNQVDDGKLSALTIILRPANGIHVQLSKRL